MNWKKNIHEEYIVNPYEKTYKKVVHCYECKYYRTQYNDWDVCELYDTAMLEQDFCSRGKEKEK